VDEGTLKVDRSLRTPGAVHPPGLLVFHPLEGGDQMRFHALEEDLLEIGRSPECGVVLPDTEASRIHARLERAGDGWRVFDLGSANGVFVNGSRVASRPLRGGEVVRIGATLCRFLDPGTAPASRHHEVLTTGLLGGPSVDGLVDVLTRAAKSDLNVLITGETGTGKELAARHVHQASDRAELPFLAVNCAAVPAEIAESELFGHVKGAFTGALADAPGLIRQAHGGTLFLDEIGEMPAPIQAKLLRVLQDHRVRPVGGAADEEVAIRLIAATNLDLNRAVSDGRFRADLHARIAELEVALPPLRRRIEDIPLLVEHFLAKHGAPGASVAVEVLELLCCQRWPYNVRQLENTVRRALVLAKEKTSLGPEHFLPASGAGDAGNNDADEQPGLSDPAEIELDRALAEHEGDVHQAAAALGISRSQLYRRAKMFGIQPQRYRRG
jgi:transcriptional regulator with PAS, ATPase and Fis domain